MTHILMILSLLTQPSMFKFHPISFTHSNPVMEIWKKL